MTPAPSWSWPDAARWRAFLKFDGMFFLCFVPVYFGGGHLAAAADHTFGLYLAWEREIPFVPWMIWPYLSLLTLFQLPLLHLDPRQIAVLSRQATLTLLAAGACFLLLPTHAGFAPAAVPDFYQPLFALLAAVDTPHNLAPSLHVAFSALILLGCASRTSSRLAWCYRGWLLLLSLSTLLVHQHHLFDVASGLWLALVMRRLFPLGA